MVSSSPTQSLIFHVTEMVLKNSSFYSDITCVNYHVQLVMAIFKLMLLFYSILFSVFILYAQEICTDKFIFIFMLYNIEDIF